MTTSTSTSTTATSITPSQVASDASEPVVLPTLREQAESKRGSVATIIVNRYRTDLQLDISGSALDPHRFLKVDDVIEARIKLRSGASSKVVGQIVARGTTKGTLKTDDDEMPYEEIVYSVALLNSDTLKKNGWDFRTEWSKLSTALLLVQKSDGTHLLDRNGRTRPVTIPVTPSMIIASDSTYRKVRESLKQQPQRKTATQNKSTNLAQLLG